MLYFIRTFKNLSLSLIVCTAVGCSFESKHLSSEYNKYQFDTKVIEKLPLYDSLVASIIAKFSFFQQYMGKDESYRAFRYMPASDQEGVVRKLAPEVAPGIESFYTQLGKDFIYGFDVFKDSTIKIYIRSRPLDKQHLDIQENLSYFPLRSSIRKREFPIKDSILNDHWQYWTRINERDVF